MDRKLAFKLLEIEETKDETIIKNAYRTKLMKTNPEDDPEGFKKLRQIYELIINTKDEVEEDTSIKSWIRDAEKIYSKISTRTDESNWKELFSRGICRDFETTNEIKEAFLGFLSNNFRLSSKVWELIDYEFEFENTKQELYELFSPNFIDFITGTVENKAWDHFNLFEGTDESDIDGYILELSNLCQSNDYKQYDEYEEIVSRMEGREIWHPYFDVEKIRFYLSNDQIEEAVHIAERLEKRKYTDLYILYSIALSYLDAGRVDEAYEIAQKILIENPEYFGVKQIVAAYDFNKGDFEKSKDIYLDLLEVDGYNDRINFGFDKVNRELISIYEKGLINDPMNKKIRLELGWCLLQCNLCKECVELVKGMDIDDENRYNYYNLMSRAYIYLEDYDNAYNHILHWLEEIKKAKDDGTDEMRNRIKRFSLAYYLLYKCHYNSSSDIEDKKENLEKCIEYLDLAIESGQNENESLKYMLDKAQVFIKLEEYKKCVDVCDKIIDYNKNYYPAYVFRQEAYYNLKMGTEVINDFYKAVDIYNGEIKPYVLAAKVFLFYNQTQEAQNVINMAKEAKLESNEIELCQLKIRVNNTENHKVAEELIEEINCFFASVSEEPGDIEDLSEILHQLAIAYYNIGEYNLALETIDKKLEMNITTDSRVLHADCLYMLKDYKEAANEYNKLILTLGDYIYGYYKLGKCFAKLNEDKEAQGCYEKVIELDSEHPYAHSDLSEIFKKRYKKSRDREDYGLAVVHGLKQIELVQDSHYYNQLGLLYLYDYELEKAVAVFREGLKHNSEDKYCHNNMGFAYKIMGEYKKSYECYELALKYQDKDDLMVYDNLADFYHITKQYPKAISMYGKMLETAENKQYILEEIAKVYLHMGEWYNAIKTYEKAYNIEESRNFTGTGIVKNLLNFKKEFYTWQSAISGYMSDQSEKSKKKKEDYLEYLIRVGDIKIFSGEYIEAEQYYFTALEKYPRSSQPYEHMGDYIMWIVGDCDKALEYYQDAYNFYKTVVGETDYYLKVNLTENIASAYLAMGFSNKCEKYINDIYEYLKEYYNSIELYLSDPNYRKIRLYNLSTWNFMIGNIEEAKKYMDLMLEAKNCRSCKYEKCCDYLVLEGLLMESNKEYTSALEKYQEALAISPDEVKNIGRIFRVKKILEGTYI